MTSTVTSIVPAWCSRAQKGWSGTINKKLHEAEWHNVAGGCNLVFFFGVTHLQNNWIGVYVAVLFANFRKTLLLQLLSSLFFGGILVAKAYICRHLRGKILTTSTFTLLFFLCHLLLQMAQDSGSPECVNIVSMDKNPWFGSWIHTIPICNPKNFMRLVALDGCRTQAAARAEGWGWVREWSLKIVLGWWHVMNMMRNCMLQDSKD